MSEAIGLTELSEHDLSSADRRTCIALSAFRVFRRGHVPKEKCHCDGIAAFFCVLLFPVAAGRSRRAVSPGRSPTCPERIIPGVTVEATSPVLIEKVRSAVTDGEGRYRLIDLRPGTYVVTFRLAGFNTFGREGIVLPAGFTAAVDVQMRVGDLAETVTVSRESPLVDVQNVRQQTSVSDEALDALPAVRRT